MVEVTVAAAFIGGLVSFLSPCVLPLIPGFLAYLSGTTAKHIHGRTRARMFLNSLMFVLGFSLVFSLLGVLLFTALTNVAYSVQLWLSRFGGVIIILFGLYVLGLIKLGFLEREHKLKLIGMHPSYLTSFVFGAAFAVGWTPCVSAVLGSVLALAISQPALSFFLLIAYTLGLGLPFLIVGLFSEQAVRWINKSETFLKYFNIIVGLFLIALGILVFTQTLNLVANLSLLNSYLLS